jgi:hypothetical protein
MTSNADLYKEQKKYIKDMFLGVVHEYLQKSLSNEERDRAMEMLTAIEIEKLDGLMEEYYNDYQAKKLIEKPDGKRQDFRKIFHEKIWGLVDSTYSIKLDANKPKNKYATKEGIEARATELESKFCRQTKKQLIQELVRETIRVEILKQEVEELCSGNQFLTYHYFKDLLKRKETVKNQKSGKDKVFSNNNQCMQECLDEVLKAGSAEKDISKKVYRRFCKLVEKRYPTPPFVQKIRQSAYEKSQREELQKIDSEALERKEWAPTTLRAFFEKTLKIKIANLS